MTHCGKGTKKESNNLSIIPIAVTGLKQAGKSSLVTRIVTGKFSETTTIYSGASISTRIYQNRAQLQLFDLGNQESFNLNKWKTYVKLSRGLIYVIDAADRDKIDEACKWFWKVNSWLTKETACIALLLNKWDQNHIEFEALTEILNLSQLSHTPTRSFRLFTTSIKTGYNFEAFLSWFKDKIIKNEQSESITIHEIYVLNKNKEEIFHLSPTRKDITSEKIELISGLFKTIEKYSNRSTNVTSNLKTINTKKHTMTIVRSAGERAIYCAVTTYKNDSLILARTIADEILQKVLENFKLVSKNRKMLMQIIENYLAANYGNAMSTWYNKNGRKSE